MQNAIASILIYSCLKRSIFEAADERGRLLGVEKFLLAITYAIYKARRGRGPSLIRRIRGGG